MKAKNIVVYVRAADVRMLEEQGKDPAEFIRTLARRALDRLKEEAK